MSPLLAGTAVVVTLIAAVRSTWSPCGWSMLSTITPLTERSRQHRFGATAGWFLVGAAIGGTLLGALGAAGAALVSALDPASDTVLLLAAVAAAVAVAFDARLLRPQLPHHRRQVNEQWLDEFRPWVYGAGFGLQIGAGLATYIMTAGVYLVVLFGALSGSAAVAFGLGTLFGLVRGSAVLAGRHNDTPRALAAFHRRFESLTEPVRRLTVAVLAAATVALLGGSIGLATPLAVALAAPVLVTALRAQARQAGATDTAARPSLSTRTSDDRRMADPTTA